MIAAEGDGGEHVFFIARNYNADRDLAIVGAVGGIEGAAARVEAYLTPKMAAERSFQRGGNLAMNAKTSSSRNG